VGNSITSEARRSPDSAEVVAFESRLQMRYCPISHQMLLSEVVFRRVGRKQEGEKGVADGVSSKSAELDPTPPTPSLQFFPTRQATVTRDHYLLHAFFVCCLLGLFLLSKPVCRLSFSSSACSITAATDLSLLQNVRDHTPYDQR
jgi:hypothetical protein